MIGGQWREAVTTKVLRLENCIRFNEVIFNRMTGYPGVLRFSLFADYEQIFNEGLQPQDQLNIISFACKVAL